MTIMSHRKNQVQVSVQKGITNTCCYAHIQLSFIGYQVKSLLKVHTFMQGFFQGVLGARLGSLK